MGFLYFVFVLAALVALALFVVAFWVIAKSIAEWHSNNNSPIISLEARVISKNMAIRQNGRYVYRSTSITF